MKQEDFNKVCRAMANMCDKLYLSLNNNEIKNRTKFLRYATIFDNFAKIKLKEKK